MNETSGREAKYASIGMAVGLGLGGLAGLIFGLATEQTSLWLILGAGGGMVIGLAGGSALDRLVEKRSAP